MGFKVSGFSVQVSGTTFPRPYETTFKITVLLLGTKTRWDDMYFNLGAWCLVAERITSKFLFRSDWTLAASGGARVKLRQNGTVS